MKTVVSILTVGLGAGFAASTVVHIRGLAGGPGDPWPLLAGTRALAVALRERRA